MDVEKTIEFLLNIQASSQAASDTRFAELKAALLSNTADIKALTSNVEALTSNVNQLDTVIDSLAQSMIRINEQSAERDRQLGERIDKLVVGIGEFMRQSKQAPQA